jgi:transcriptional regulator with XRE-family HTH domain
MSDNSPLGEKVRQIRKTLGMTQEEFAFELGVEPLHISCIERGTRRITLDRLIELHRKFNISVDDLLSAADYDVSMKNQWIDEIVGYLKEMEPLQVCLLKRMIGSMRIGPRYII